MPLDKYPKNDEQIIQWNNYINSKKIYPIELLINISLFPVWFGSDTTPLCSKVSIILAALLYPI